jgi:hypothetical protein
VSGALSFPIAVNAGNVGVALSAATPSANIAGSTGVLLKGAITVSLNILTLTTAGEIAVGPSTGAPTIWAVIPEHTGDFFFAIPLPPGGFQLAPTALLQVAQISGNFAGYAFISAMW